MAGPLRILIVEDDPSIVEFVRLGLSYEGVEVSVASDGREAVRMHHEELPDLVLLDLMLPGLGGLAVLERIRSHRDTPVIVLTARDGLEDRVAGLNAGADDYVTKPFRFAELLARIQAVLRRHGLSRGEVIEVADLRIDLEAHEVSRAGLPVHLTARQFEVLVLLADNARRVLSKERIYDRIWGSDQIGDVNVVEQHISRLRERVDHGHERKLIHTVRGVGYVIREEGAR